MPSKTALPRGIVAVIVRNERLLVVRRSATVVAPRMLCFPGGGIESAETEEMAVQRELQEELGIDVAPLARIWTSVTPWNVALSWWRCHLPENAVLNPNPAEVEEVHWMSPSELAIHPDLLESNARFLKAIETGEISWPFARRPDRGR